jgi:hypothetical protein
VLPPERRAEKRRIALTGLQKRLAALPPWTPAAAAAGVFALILGVGISLLNSGSGTIQPAPSAVAANRPVMAPPQSPRPSAAWAGRAPQATAPPAALLPNQADPFISQLTPAPPNPLTAAAAGTRAPAIHVPLLRPENRNSAGSAPPLPPPPPPRRFTPGTSSSPGALPDPNQSQGMQVAAANPAPGGVERIPAGPPPQAGSDPPPGATGGGSPPAPGGDGSYIRIKVGAPPPAAQGANSGGSSSSPATPSSAPNGGDPLLRAQNLQQGGQYSEAIESYQQTLRTNAQATGEAYQGIALSHQRLGNNEAARSAYRQAIAAYEAQVAAGRDVAAAQRAINSCKAALEVLGDG